jgi:uncharacterized membrane protein YbhN (UPF0104 family)
MGKMVETEGGMLAEGPGVAAARSEQRPVSQGGQQPAMQGGQLRKRRVPRRLLGLALVVVVLTLLGVNLGRSWNTLAAYRWQVSAPLLVLAFAGFVGQTLSYPLIWRLVLRRLGYALSVSKSTRIYLASEFVRYVPGNVWHVLTRILWVEREGVPKSLGLVSMTVELVTKLASGALVFAVTLLFWPRVDVLGQAVASQGLTLLIGLAAIPVLLALLQPRLLAWCLNGALKVMRKEPVSLPMRYRDVLLVCLYWCGSWVIGGCAFYALVLGTTGTGGLASGDAAAGGAGAAGAGWFSGLVVLVLCVGIYALAWDIGFLSFLTPSGLGFREAAIAVLLGLSLVTPNVALATVLAFLSRILATLAELVCVCGAHLVVRRRGE